MSSPVQWERHGDEFTFVWPSENIGINVAHLRENRERDLVCELAPYELVGDETLPLMAPSKANINSPRGKSEIIGTLNRRRTFPDDAAFTWGDAIESVALVVLREYRRGQPVIDLSGIDVPDDLPYLLFPFLPEGETTIVYGDRSSGKSMFSMGLSVAIRTGAQLPWARKPTKTGSVLYLDYETNEISQARRLGRVSRGLGFDQIPTGVYYRRCWRPITEEATRIATEAARFQVELIVVDSIAYALGDDPNAPGAAIAAMNAIRSIGKTALVIAHVNKNERQNGRNASVFGSVFFEASMRMAWEVRGAPGPNKGSRKMALYHRKASDDELLDYPLGMTLEFPETAGKPVVFASQEIPADDPLAAGTSIPARIRTALLRAKRPVTVEELATYLEVKPGTVRTTLNRMKDVVNIGGKGQPGRYGLSAEGQAAAEKEAAAESSDEPLDPDATDVAECIACQQLKRIVRVIPPGDPICADCDGGS